MPKGLKANSSTIMISGSVAESAANTFTQAQVDLQLNPLDNEVFVVTAINLDLQSPDAVAATNTQLRGSLSTTSLTSFGSISQSQVMAAGRLDIRAAGFVDGGVPFDVMAGETPTGELDYVAIIATNDFFAQIVGTNNAAAKSMSYRVYGYRARADSSTYAALVQSEVLSS